MVFKTWTSGCEVLRSLRDGRNEGILPLREFPGQEAEGENPGVDWQASGDRVKSLERPRWDLQDRAPRRRDLHRQQGPQGPAEGPSWVFRRVLITACTWGNYPRPRKEPSERDTRTMLTQGWESQTHNRKTHHSQALRKNIQEGLALVWGQLTLNWGQLRMHR